MLAGIWELEYTLFKWVNRKFRLENQMDRPIPLEDLKKNGLIKKLEAMPFFLLLLVCSANLDRLCSKSFSHHFKFYSFMFTHKISTRVVCVNRKSPSSQFRLKSLRVLSHWVCLFHSLFIGQM